MGSWGDLDVEVGQTDNRVRFDAATRKRRLGLRPHPKLIALFRGTPFSAAETFPVAPFVAYLSQQWPG